MRKVMCCLSSVMVVVMLMGFSIGVVQAGTCEIPDFNASNFTSPIANQYFPMAIGDVYVYEAEEEDELIRNYIHFSTDTKVILGVTCTVVYDVEWIWVQELNGGLGDWRKLEETQDWHAWDNSGNFWYFGEWTTEYEYNDNWVLTGSNNEGSWEAGVASAETGIVAEPGIILLADPTPGDCVIQEYAPDDALDRGKVLRLNAKVSVEYDDYEDGDVLVTKEWSELEPGNVEHKYYALGDGLVYIEELKEKTVKVELVDIDVPPIPDPPTDTPSL